MVVMMLPKDVRRQLVQIANELKGDASYWKSSPETLYIHFRRVDASRVILCVKCLENLLINHCFT